jgi:hypothetical protein
MTGSAEIDRISRTEARRIENERWSPRIVFYAHLRDMLCSGAVARFAGNARNQLFGMKLIIRT